MTRLLFMLLFSTLVNLSASGQEPLSKNKRWREVQDQFNTIPADRLQPIERELNSIIAANDCYKFIYNRDTTKFLAFFLNRKDDPAYPRLTHFGQVVHVHRQASAIDTIHFYGYVLWGMKFKDQWYYNKTLEDEFWGNNLQSATVDYLFYTLKDVGYLKARSERFWLLGGDYHRFKILPKNTSYLEEYAGLPEMVGWHKTAQGGMQKQLWNERIEATACAIEDSLWNALHSSDSTTFNTRYHSTHSGKSCFVLYNADRNKVLLPILYYDSRSTPWVSYYYLHINAAAAHLYKWAKIPTKRIDRKPGDETLEMVYDIRNFIKNWGWGTVNMISEENFWANNFTDKDVEPVEK